MSQPLIYQRVRLCANLFWSDLEERFDGHGLILQTGVLAARSEEGAGQCR
jgi:hypothetical protein